MRHDREEAFRTFVVEHRAELVRTATLLTSGDVHRAEDLVQVTLTRLYVAWHRIDGRRSPGAYARRVLVNAFIDDTRRPLRRRERSHGDLPERAVPGSPGYEEREVVHRALTALPPRMRAAVVLRHWLQLDVRETADVLGCSEGTVKSQTARGLDRLRELLEVSADPPRHVDVAP
jgi:RNA polymerase sigma-70 factor (sigma-E family)